MIAARHVLTAVLLLAVLAAVGVIGWETDWGRQWRGDAVNATAKARTLDTKVLPVFALAPLTDGYKETIERPLFVPTRRPAPAGGATQTAMKKGQFRLAGTTVSNEVSIAYLFEMSTNKTHRVNKGADINGMTVEMVAANRVTLKQGDESEELSLRTSTSPKPPPPPQQVAGAPGQPGAMPGVPGGNFGVPQQPGQSAPMAASGVAMNAANGSVQGSVQPPPAAGSMAGAPPQPFPAGVATAPPPAATATIEAPPPNDPNQPQMRRRRFQNLPQ